MRIDNNKFKNLLISRKKLCLILDLDHTLVHSTYVYNAEVRSFSYLVKLRPFVQEFLKEASKLFEMYIYTLASRGYALGVARILDPDGVYFGSRIIASEDSTEKYEKSLDVVPGVDESFVVILDDLVRVWSGYLRNLIVVRRYFFFDPPNRVFRDEHEGSGALSCALKILKEVHTLYFSRDDLSGDCDVRDLLEIVMKNLYPFAVVDNYKNVEASDH
ncbi:hypothetical protein DCAR_0626202 [Daucus carota subsp. sativus]|uniref:protein-serine/threonine phosphatase n=1 Tax=Daucus carota subsp. sativus TaxID=79200 RepID=A0AAF0XHA7_DAUCS|nr:PREDICTED: RNA polymerase II C-terminal domain phosphatase-like 4 [Daucus carota subsp. sativus]WOH06774.1 hypothetical protein DCAR_0626202 [Daucus carota subsp. sativus]